MSERRSAFRYAKEHFWHTVLWWRGLLLLLACEAVVAGVVAYTANAGTHSPRVWAALAAGVVVGGAGLAFLLAFLALWAVAPHRMVKVDVAALSTRVEALESKPAVVQGSPVDDTKSRERVALFAVRSELGGCADRIIRARNEYGRWWDAKEDPLPGDKWREHFADLTRIPDELNVSIDLAYKACDSLNHLARYYVRSLERQTHFAVLAPQPGPTELNDYDKEQLDAAKKKIDETNAAISDYLNKH